MERKELRRNKKIIFAPGYVGSDRRRNSERRTGKKRRKHSNPNYTGPERRTGKERRSGEDRRKIRQSAHLL